MKKVVMALAVASLLTGCSKDDLGTTLMLIGGAAIAIAVLNSDGGGGIKDSNSNNP